MPILVVKDDKYTLESFFDPPLYQELRLTSAVEQLCQLPHPSVQTRLQVSEQHVIAAAVKSSDVYARIRVRIPLRLRAFAVSKQAPPAVMTQGNGLVDLLLAKVPPLRSGEGMAIGFPKCLA